MNRKLWANEEKVVIVMEILRGDEPAVVMMADINLDAAFD